MNNLPKRVFANKRHWNLVANNNYSWLSDCKRHEHLCSIKTLQGFNDYQEVKPAKSEEWPQVGDEVYVTKKVLDNNSMQEAAELISETYCELISKFTHNEVEFCVLKNESSAYTSLILDLCLSDKTIVKSKPKTKEDILTEELQAKLCNNNYVDNFTLASDIINGMIPGLSYNSDIESAVKGVINKHLDGDA